MGGEAASTECVGVSPGAAGGRGVGWGGVWEEEGRGLDHSLICRAV